VIVATGQAQPPGAAQEGAPGSDPRAQALKLYQVIQKQDWESLYFLVLFAPKLKLEMTGHSKEFAGGVREGIGEDGAKTIDELFNNMSEIAIGEPIIKGNKAEVPTSCRDIVKGKTVFFKGTAHMIKDGEVWKWDLTSSEDIGQATSQELIALIGTPSVSP
jgi:hypothetical protein